ncbi:hypothetical protein [Pelagicoccus sp. SDUM812002]|uniref:sodium:solute symporter family protein n=1 Tax=Pelagicoccus sp. SDUM812002 TaxID=3041266 RepID=UPI00280D5F1C|nr:hypothetical protein [Pelagicoccus sp. SDUM812002]MDQ8184645.1 hypothetical protein [Pelagicoccus sp. SDUM812002]
MGSIYITLSLYFSVLILLGIVFSRRNKNLSDYVRGGAQGTWWMVGSSMFMAGISAFTFTGNASAAFDAGPSMLIIYVANCVGFLVAWKFLAALFRRTRAFTMADIVRDRYGVGIEQVVAYAGLMVGPLHAAVQLWALAMFTSSIFSIPLLPCIVVIGCVVVFYSLTGGKWAVMATDFVQSLIMIPVTILVAGLSLWHMGGWDAFVTSFSDPRFASDFSFVKDSDQFPDAKFSWSWIWAIFFMQILSQVGLGSASRYFSAKDEREASRGALLAFFLMFVGAALWFLPPMVARFLYEEEVLAMDVSDPAAASYAFMALKVLPPSMVGIMVAAMFSATMSSMDSGLNEQTGIIVRNLLPRVRARLGMGNMGDRANLLACKLVTALLGVLVVGYAGALSQQTEIRLFDIFFFLAPLISMPMALPLLAALFIKRIPYWSYFVIFAFCAAPSLWSLVDAELGGEAWSVQERTLGVFVGFGLSLVICRLGYRGDKVTNYSKRSDAFFDKLSKPVDFKDEIGASKDKDQLTLMGRVCLLAAGLLCLLFFGAGEWADVFSVTFLVASVAAVGGLLLLAAGREPSSE